MDDDWKLQQHQQTWWFGPGLEVAVSSSVRPARWKSHGTTIRTTCHKPKIPLAFKYCQWPAAGPVRCVGWCVGVVCVRGVVCVGVGVGVWGGVCVCV